jgi:hypothetical protein
VPRLARPLSVAAVVVVLGAAAAAASTGPRLQHTAAGNAAARLGVATAADFATIGSGWARAPIDHSDDNFSCAGFNPDESAFVEIGSAESRFTHAGGLTVQTNASVLQTVAMVRADTAKTIGAPGFLACLKHIVVQALAGHAATVTNVKITRLALPTVGDRLIAYRTTLKATFDGQTIPVLFDLVYATRGRTQIAILAGAPVLAGVADAMYAFDSTLSARLVGRARA